MVTSKPALFPDAVFPTALLPLGHQGRPHPLVPHLRGLPFSLAAAFARLLPTAGRDCGEEAWERPAVAKSSAVFTDRYPLIRRVRE